MKGKASQYLPQSLIGCQTNFSFLHGASHPEEVMQTAASYGWQAIGIADLFGVGGLVRAWSAARDIGYENATNNKQKLAPPRLISGARIALRDGGDLMVFVRSLDGYESLCQWLSAAMMRSGHRQREAPDLYISDLSRLSAETCLITIPPIAADTAWQEQARAIAQIAKGRVYAGGYLMRDGCDEERLYQLKNQAEADALEFIALGEVLYHDPARRPLADVLHCIRQKTTLAEAGRTISANAERHLLSREEMARRWYGFEEALLAADALADSCEFRLEDISYAYPEHDNSRSSSLVSGGKRRGRTAFEELAWQTEKGSHKRYPDGVPEKVKAFIERELALVKKLNYAPFFLTVFEIVRFARSRNILCQGRGSAANSAICYCLFITSVDPERSEPLFERFISEARDEPPDIDVDFEHNRREEVIQYIYHRYGRHRAGLVSAVITYRWRSALVETAKAFGLSRDVQRALSAQVWRGNENGIDYKSLQAAGVDRQDPSLKQVLLLARQLYGFPRHLSQHSGGFVIVRDRLDKICVIRPAAMQGRSIIEWDKDDIDALGLLKIDVLALGMLSCLAGAFQLMQHHYYRRLSLASIPPEDKQTYDMLCRGESVGVFQVESRAQMAMLPRLQPRSFHDLVVQVAIVRPGPIQGDMVHPYLRRRAGLEYVSYPSEELRAVLERTLGVPLFQEQAMKIAIVGAGFSGADADRLRRAMATFRKNGEIHKFHDKMINGMVARGYDAEFATACFRQIEGFGTYGFPESHAASFALLVYASAWLKCHYPEVFSCALLNAQPMGFYRPAQLIADAKRSGVEVRAIDINASEWDASLEPSTHGRHALRLGLRLIKGLREADAARIIACRGSGYDSLATIVRRADVPVKALEVIVAADGLQSLGLDSRQAYWQIRKMGRMKQGDLPLFAFADSATDEASVIKEKLAPAPLPKLGAGEAVAQDYALTGLSLKAHPLELLATAFTRDRWQSCSVITTAQNGQRLRLIGLVTSRQRPGTAKGTMFLTIEDSELSVNIIVWPHIAERDRTALLGAHVLGIYGRVQKEGIVTHFIADALHACDHYLGLLQAEPPSLEPDNIAANASDRLPANKGAEMQLKSRDFR
ncbi:MAG: error-prone DNA polymerase [Alphaproteobacteria bacterium]|nr:error-prone DNA polymerase [Alphaproteobacteria bacterium]MBL6776714.1 error-prone DNA polymerase [Alphaproteobacteria bacterium]